MKILVQKFGGTSVKDEDSRAAAEKHIAHAISLGYKVIVVVSAIGRLGDPYATDSLLSLIGGNRSYLDLREKDMLLSVGETISTAVFTNGLKKNGIAAVGLTGQDAGIVTNEDFGNAKVKRIDQTAITRHFKFNDVVVVTGFQGISENGHITTIGRGGSDTTAAFLGASFEAESIDIFTDVSGMMTADPRLVDHAQFLEVVSYREVSNMAHEGAKVIDPRAVEIAMQAGIPLRIRSTHQPVTNTGTLVTHIQSQIEHYRLVTGIAHVPNLVQFRVEADPVMQEKIFTLLAKRDISVDFINIFPNQIIFTLPQTALENARSLFEKLAVSYSVIENCAKVAIVGAGITGVPGIVSKIVTTLVDNQVSIHQSADSYTTIWILVAEVDLKVAVNSLHTAFLENEK
ncbi:aspartate kinase [Carnobacterium iners]|uniref:Aspartokinase n=1 Tax=Carnobacterium iners TaxID=1073423 RepID=A0A1X7NNY1_9LACT|nr:aspartate kinase [Carnobacterium iners]SEK29789.1 aspartate kinase [Carnobacterium iners]SMH39705.1 aspartate kinase [Carnobacterium iners]